MKIFVVLVLGLAIPAVFGRHGAGRGHKANEHNNKGDYDNDDSSEEYGSQTRSAFGYGPLVTHPAPSPDVRPIPLYPHVYPVPHPYPAPSPDVRPIPPYPVPAPDVRPIPSPYQPAPIVRPIPTPYQPAPIVRPIPTPPAPAPKEDYQCNYNGECSYVCNQLCTSTVPACLYNKCYCTPNYNQPIEY